MCHTCRLHTRMRLSVCAAAVVALLSVQIEPAASTNAHGAAVIAPPSGHSSASRPAIVPVSPGRLRITALPLALRFEANRGQFDRRVEYLARTNDGSIVLTSTGVVLSLWAARPARRSRATRAVPSGTADVRLTFAHALPHPRVSGCGRLPGVSAYFIGNDPRRWHTRIPSYVCVVYHRLYPGIDVVFHGRAGHLEYDWHLAPGARPHSILLRITGTAPLALDAHGALVLRLGGAVLRQETPAAYQQIGAGGRRRPIAVSYVLRGTHEVSFALGPYNPRDAVVIDPVLTSSVLLGGHGTTTAGGIAIDGAHNIYVVGTSSAPDYPTTPGAVQPGPAGGGDIVVTKLGSDGQTLLYSTYLGGSGSDAAAGLAVDSAGNAYITGASGSTDFPTHGGIAGAPGGAFVTKLAPTGGALVYSTFLIGSGLAGGEGIALDGAGAAYVTGTAGSHVGVTKLNASGNALVYTTSFGGSGLDDGHAIAVDATGAAYVTGQTSSQDFPVTPGAFQPGLASYCQGSGYPDPPICNPTGFVTKLSADGKTLLYSTYLGGNVLDIAYGIAVGGAGDAYITGQTSSSTFPILHPFQLENGTGGCLVPNCQDAFVTELNPSGSGLVYSSYLGGSGTGEQGRAIAVDGAGEAYVTGLTDSTDFPTPTNPPQAANHGLTDAFVVKVQADGTLLAYGTYLGGSNADSGGAIAVDGAGHAYIAGTTYSSDFPTTAAITGSVGPPGDGSTAAIFVAQVTETPADACPPNCQTTWAALPGWQTSAALPTPRSHLAAAAGPDGRVYAIGGDAADGTALGTVEAYDPVSGSWQVRAPLPTARGSLTAATGRDGRIYAIGGFTPVGGYLATVEAYDPAQNRWTAVAPLPTPRENAAAVAAADGRLYVIGGEDASGAMATVEAYDPGTNTWQPRASMPTPRTGLGAALGRDGRIYAAGGSDSNGYLSTLAAYDPATNSWQSLRAMPTPRAFLAAVTGADGRIYAVGGVGYQAWTPHTVEAYDPASPTWSQWQPLPGLVTGRSWPGVATGADGRIYAIGGDPGGGAPALDSVEAYGPVIDTQPRVVAPGATVDVTGTSFAPLATVTLSATTALSQSVVATGTTNASGALVTPLTITAPTAQGPFTLTASDDLSHFPVALPISVLGGAPSATPTLIPAPPTATPSPSPTPIGRATPCADPTRCPVTTWTTQLPSGIHGTLEGVACPTTLICEAVGIGATLLGTTNGGATWQTQNSVDLILEMDAVACPSSSDCVAAGTNQIIVTTDGGQSWHLRYSGQYFDNYHGVACASTSACYVVGDNGAIVATTDGGTTWAAQNSRTTHALYGIACSGASSCTIAGAGGAILTTTNGGASWLGRYTGVGNDLHSVTCPAPERCLAVGTGGTVLTTTNGGQTWSAGASGSGDTLYSIVCPSVQICYASGDNGNSNGGLLLSSLDGGASWTAVTSLGATIPPVKALACPMAGVCEGVGYGNMIIAGRDSGQPATQSPTPTPTTTPTVTPTRTPTRTPTATATATGGASLSLSRSSGRYKDTVTASGTGFGAGEPVSLYLDSMETPPLTQTTSNAAGTFATTFSVPQAISGTHTLLAAGQSSGRQAGAPFVILPAAMLLHYQGYKGTTDVLRGAGFAPYETVRGYWASTSGMALSTTATTNGLGTFGGSAEYPGITFTVPLSPTGTYAVYAVGQASGGVAHATFTLKPYLNLKPSSGPPGSQITIVGTGYGAAESVSLKYNCGQPACTSTTLLATPRTDGNGYFSTVVTIPASTHSGQHSIGGAGSVSSVFATNTFTVP